MVTDIIIIGQGLAGSMLALSLIEEGFKVIIINHEDENNSSRVAAGIVNPITGKRVVKTWLADELFPTLHSYYKNMETLLDRSFFYPKLIYKPFDTISEQNYCISKSGPEDYANYMEINPNNEHYKTFLNNPLGGFEIKEGGYLDTNTFLDSAILFFKKNNVLINRKINIDEIKISENSVEIGDIKASKIIFCDGHHVTKNPYFNWLPFAPAKGEVLTIESKSLATENAISKGIFILPNGENKFRVGATYAWTYDDVYITDKAKNELCQKLDEIINVPYQVIDHKAGIRPATKFRKPLIGQHPTFKQIGIFNGFGSKGVTLIPYFALQYVQFLKNKSELSADVNIEQYLSLYLKSNNQL